MPKELEAKVRVDGLAPVIAALGAAGATRLGSAGQVNVFYDHPDGRLRSGGCGLRIRTADNGSSVTFKGPLQPGPYKLRDEWETDIGDPAVLEAVFRGLGLREVFRFSKHRESWSLDGCQVDLDDVPELGTFVEVEGPDVASVARVLGRIGLGSAPVIRQGYVELILAERALKAAAGG